MKKYYKTLAAVSAAMTSAIAGMHYANVLISRQACKKELLFDQEGSYYSFRFGNVFYTRQGKGTPLLLIHQLHPACSHIEFKSLTEELSNHYTVYTMDLPGCGRSDKPALTYTSYMYVQLLNDFISHVIGERTHIICSGISAIPLLMACSIEPDLYDKILLINPPAPTCSSQAPNAWNKLFKNILEIPIAGTFLYNIIFTRKRIRKLLEKKVFYTFPEGEISSYLLRQKEKCADYLYEGVHLQDYGSKYLYSSLKANYLNANILNAVRTINNSIYIVMGKEEPHCLDTISEYKTANCSIETAILPKTKKVPHLESPSRFLHIAEIFLS